MKCLARAREKFHKPVIAVSRLASLQGSRWREPVVNGTYRDADGSEMENIKRGDVASCDGTNTSL